MKRKGKGEIGSPWWRPIKSGSSSHTLYNKIEPGSSKAKILEDVTKKVTILSFFKVNFYIKVTISSLIFYYVKRFVRNKSRVYNLSNWNKSPWKEEMNFILSSLILAKILEMILWAMSQRPTERNCEGREGNIIFGIRTR